ncbi:hypothetical protein F511_34576 [Dorcoceras hygrometricum]|uniref:Uncharacterized protein n=1 Tax=Dorcoceras hygrometricum TaxID=472368 RepID=A0A2Z7BNH7_9LAMI|nr:hypothetical protein F511_34576 [Dorcoceras hygrometricum]
MMLPSITAAEITKIRCGESININEVQERDLYFASLPRISMHDKGKEILEEDEPVKWNPAREMVELICGDVEFLVKLRDRVMLDVVNFFHSFSLNKLSDLDGLRDLKEKEKLMLDWAETDSFETAVKRKMYILAKYREMLLRKFLASHRRYFSPGQPWTAMASQIIALLSVAHSKSLEDLLAQPMILVNGVWTPIQGNDFWRSSFRLTLFVNKKQQPDVVIEENFFSHCLFIEPVQYWGAAPYLIKTWGWARVCTEVVRYSMFGCLPPVRKDVCTDIVVYSLAVERIPASFRRIFAQVYRSPSPISQEADSSVPEVHFALGPVNFGAAQEEQSYYVQSPESPPPTFQHQVTSASSSGSPMHFTRDDIPLDATTDDLKSLPVGPNEFHTALDDLRAFILQRIDDSNNAHTMSDVQKIHLNEFKKVVLAQGVTAGADSLETRKEFKELDAKINSLDGQVAAIRNEQLEFQTKIAADILSLSTQLGDIVDYIRGGDAKRGGSSSSRPLPTHVHQSEGSGDVLEPTEISQRDIDNAQRDILERMMRADRERERESRKAVISKDDVSFISRQQAVISNYDVSNISRQPDGSAIVTSAYLLKMQKTEKRGC